ncbi:hypothetical protein KCP77_23695 [Salmonella enterica subsp. enterica]|nr:hypothetical protein KCP77_23695 [Salmonella enterica subsp. enterica]
MINSENPISYRPSPEEGETAPSADFCECSQKGESCHERYYQNRDGITAGGTLNDRV